MDVFVGELVAVVLALELAKSAVVTKRGSELELVGSGVNTASGSISRRS